MFFLNRATHLVNITFQLPAKTQEHTQHFYHAIVLSTVNNKNPDPADRKAGGGIHGLIFKVLQVADDDLSVCFSNIMQA